MNGKGFAQLLVLWALVLLGVLGMSFAYAMRTEALASRNGLDGVRAYFQARTGINRTIALFSSASPDNVLGTEISGEDGDASYRVAVTSESGKVDINNVPEELLKEILRNGGITPEEAQSIGDAILDWRDADDDAREFGAEETYYASLPEPVRPRNGYLAGISELLSVKGVTPDVYRGLLAKVFTVHGKSARVDINQAPAALLGALPGFTPELADAVLAKRKEDPFRTPVDIATFFAGTEGAKTAVSLFSTASTSNVFTVVSRGTAAGRIRRSIRCVLEVGRTGTDGATIVQWEDLVPAEGEEG